MAVSLTMFLQAQPYYSKSRSTVKHSIWYRPTGSTGRCSLCIKLVLTIHHPYDLLLVKLSNAMATLWEFGRKMETLTSNGQGFNVSSSTVNLCRGDPIKDDIS